MCTHDAEKLAISVLEIYKGEITRLNEADVEIQALLAELTVVE